jgi:hypothetical protein
MSCCSEHPRKDVHDACRKDIPGDFVENEEHTEILRNRTARFYLEA